jgi:hypothetical protein
VKAHRAAQPPFEFRDPVDAAAEVVEQLDSIVEKFALIAEETKHDASGSGRYAPSSRRWSRGSR